MQNLCHILALNKSLGVSSAHALNQLKRLFPRGTKIGHAGTLDPLATGVLVVLLGRATKLSDRLMAGDKGYVGTIRLGATSATDDAEGPIVASENATPVQESALRAALATFVGEIQQKAPAISALKIAGKRASDRVRAGETIELKVRTIRIDRIELKSYAWPEATIEVACGKGTYIRSIARDVGEALGVGGYLSALMRTRVGPITLQQSATLEQLTEKGVEPFLIDAEKVASL
jgi:tRNA pseudouridine55 synthase